MRHVDILLWKVEIFMMTGQDFYNHRSRFCYEWSRFLWWQVEILIMTGRDFHYDKSRFYYEPLSFHDDDYTYFDKILERQGSISPSSFDVQFPDF